MVMDEIMTKSIIKKLFEFTKKIIKYSKIDINGFTIYNDGKICIKCTPLIIAIKIKYVDIENILIENPKINLTINKTSAFIEACLLGNLELVKSIAKHPDFQ